MNARRTAGRAGALTRNAALAVAIALLVVACASDPSSSPASRQPTAADATRTAAGDDDPAYSDETSEQTGDETADVEDAPARTPTPGPTPAPDRESSVDAADATLSDRGVGPFEWGDSIEEASAFLASVLGSEPEVGFSAFDGTWRHDWNGQLFLISLEGVELDGWQVIGEDRPLPVEGLGQHLGGLQFESEPDGHRFTTLPVPASSFLGRVNWFGSGLTVDWRHGDDAPTPFPARLDDLVDVELFSIWGSDVRTFSDGRVAIFGESAVIRLSPDTSDEVIDIAEAGTQYELIRIITNEDGRWSAVAPVDTNRWTGWVRADRASRVAFEWDDGIEDLLIEDPLHEDGYFAVQLPPVDGWYDTAPDLSDDLGRLRIRPLTEVLSDHFVAVVRTTDGAPGDNDPWALVGYLIDGAELATVSVAVLDPHIHALMADGLSQGEVATIGSVNEAERTTPDGRRYRVDVAADVRDFLSGEVTGSAIVTCSLDLDSRTSACEVG